MNRNWGANTFIQYQNIVLKIITTYNFEYLIFENLPEGLEYITYNQFDIE